MKRTIIIITMLLLLLSSGLYAVDKVKKDEDSAKTQSSQKADKANYQDFTDKNNNGIDDNIEKRQKETTRVEPKREQEIAKPDPQQSGEKYTPQAPKVKVPVEKKTENKKSGEKKEKTGNQ